MLRNLLSQSQECLSLALSLLFPFAAANKKAGDDDEQQEEHENKPPVNGHCGSTMTALNMEAQLPPLHHPRVPAACDRHPGQHVTGFCASCLMERLAVLEADRKSTSSSSSALKSIFTKVATGGAGGQASSSNNCRPDLRRCKSFSGSRADGSSGHRASVAFEPQRKSCDVRGRSTLWSLFHQADVDRVGGDPDPSLLSSSGDIDIETRNLGFPPASVAAPVIEDREEEERDDNDNDNDNEIRPADPVLSVVDTSRDIMDDEEKEEDKELKPMKDHIDLDSQAKKHHPKVSNGSFWLAASVFSKKLQNWRRKQKLKKSSNGAASKIERDKIHQSSQRFRETQSEIAVDAFGRRSCDIDPRFSLDAGRMSIDDPRYSWDAPRASWDGHLIGVRPVVPRFPPMLAVGEDTHIPTVERWDGKIPVEEDGAIPGGSAQTRDYYLDSSSSSRRRRSLDRSSSVPRQSVEFMEPNPLSNAAKVSPSGCTEYFPLPNEIKHDHDSRNFSSNSLRDDLSQSFESAFRVPQKGAPKKKSRRWSKAWNIWGFIHRRGSSRGGGGAANENETNISQTWPDLREQLYNGRMFRSNSSVSMRTSISNNSGFGRMMRSSLDTKGQGKKRCGEFVLERNRSARYSPSHGGNGLLRFYLTPIRGSRRNGLPSKSRDNTTCSVTRTVLGMY